MWRLYTGKYLKHLNAGWYKLNIFKIIYPSQVSDALGRHWCVCIPFIVNHFLNYFIHYNVLASHLIIYISNILIIFKQLFFFVAVSIFSLCEAESFFKSNKKLGVFGKYNWIFERSNYVKNIIDIKYILYKVKDVFIY